MVRLSFTPSQQITITIVSFSNCFASCTSVCGEKKMRWNPLSGFSLLNFGTISCGENSSPNCSTLATTASTSADATAIPRSGVYGRTAATNRPPTERIVSSSCDPAWVSATMNACPPASIAARNPRCRATTIAMKIAELPISCERGTCPPSPASPRRFRVAFSVAAGRGLAPRGGARGGGGPARRAHRPQARVELAGLGVDQRREDRAHQRERDDQHDEPDRDLDREADDEDVHLRRDPRHQPKHHVDQEQRDRDRRGDLEDDEQRLREEAHHVAGDQLGRPGERQRDELERPRDPRDQHVMRVQGEVEQRRERELEVSDHGDVLRGERVDDVDDREADLHVDDLAGELDPGEQEERDEAEHEPDERLRQDGDRELAEPTERRHRRHGVHDDERQQQSETEPHQLRDLRLREDRHEREHTAHPHQHQQHRLELRRPHPEDVEQRSHWMNCGMPVKTLVVKSVSSASMNGPNKRIASATTTILGMNASVGSWICVTAWKTETISPGARPSSSAGAQTSSAMKIASRPSESAAAYVTAGSSRTMRRRSGSSRRPTGRSGS